MTPEGLLLDLDDTILDDSSAVSGCWDEACAMHAAGLRPLEPSVVASAIKEMARWYWDDAERHRLGRLELDRARRDVARLALQRLGLADMDLADAIGDAYSRHRDARMCVLPEAVETLEWLRAAGCRLALLTNGGGPAQRRKIVRFGLAPLFDAIFVEGEVGFGKPDPRIYGTALQALGVAPSSAWMVGDNLEFDVLAPQRLGLTGVWVDRANSGLSPEAPERPVHVITTLSDLRRLLSLR